MATISDEDDDEFIYPYWGKIYNSKKGKSLKYDKLGQLTKIEVSNVEWDQIWDFENNFPQICGRIYEALFQNRRAHVATFIEGAPIDGAADVYGLNKEYGAYTAAQPLYPGKRRFKGIFYEMKKMHRGKRDAYFKPANVSAVVQHEGLFIIATPIRIGKLKYVNYKCMDFKGDLPDVKPETFHTPDGEMYTPIKKRRKRK